MLTIDKHVHADFTDRQRHNQRSLSIGVVINKKTLRRVV